MNTMNVVRAAGALLLGASFLFTGGCGYKDLPVAPASVVPEPISDLLYNVSDKGLTLTWSYPVKTIQGTLISDISSFDLYRYAVPLADYCGGCPVPFGKAIEVDGGVVFDGKLRRKASYETSDLQSGYKYFYKVKSRTSWLAASDDSNIVSFVWYQPAKAPATLVATGGDGQVVLKWDAVTELSDGSALSEPLKYQIMRSAGGKDFIKVGKPLAATTYTDKQVRNGQKYFYTVQSLMVLEDELVDGSVTKAIAVSPRDMTPPLAPSGVTAVATSVGTKIFWDKSDALDVVGYKVYRRAADKDDYELLGKVAPEYMLYVDKKATGDVRYYYAITAIDGSTPANESEKSREATVRY
ncbi:MAG: fibronectin type 3 domain-containing protein [Desulforhopalus sp.]|jgi:fibronectin type 3 domain-containing protein